MFVYQKLFSNSSLKLGILCFSSIVLHINLWSCTAAGRIEIAHSMENKAPSVLTSLLADTEKGFGGHAEAGSNAKNLP
jgi:hypothetical protein